MMIGTRGSMLAIRQTEIFIESFQKMFPSEPYEVKEIKVSGDADQISPLHELQGFGAFVRELDDALIRGNIDVSVNSMKDMPIDPKDGVVVPAVLPRADVRDVIIPISLDELPSGSVIGTSSLRRTATIGKMRPDLDIRPLRGNIQTRIRKFAEGEYDAIVLAKAGLDRSEISVRYSVLSIDNMVPAPAQGAIAIACRSNDEGMIERLSKLDDPVTRAEVTIERYIMKATGAGCTSPIGINAEAVPDGFRVRAESFMGSVPVKVDAIIRRDDQKKGLDDVVSILKGSQ